MAVTRGSASNRECTLQDAGDARTRVRNIESQVGCEMDRRLRRTTSLPAPRSGGLKDTNAAIKLMHAAQVAAQDGEFFPVSRFRRWA